ncbi:glycine/D-amino acid oxidase-like deaminating enzyme [Rubricella aquisinus]|uniref:Glycine/D-amino acid oxidase-like deaminating enzyme n=1 Tax=Rubricella aquisinus TaxID=2028108 RepID=A0A840WJI6_9RHOB|nr:FAD-dependent oxidoreductase [Rubricella aquisinus]MBB5514681.1 glycine/D-amino acid oxidase-like deaminating enzyme [Rubricella aquisinus]
MARQGADLVVIGGGVMGLWSAWAALEAGRSVLVLDRAEPGAGASGGMIGALAPHLPDRWNPKKQYQFEALCTLEKDIAQVDAASGLTSGYGRIGRLQPLTGRALDHTEERLAGARAHWAGMAEMDLRPADMAPDWAAPDMAEAWLFDTLTARVAPRRLIASLAAAITARGGQIRTACTVTGVAPGVVETTDGPIKAETIILAAGVPAFELIAPLVAEVPGRAEKGQALTLPIAAPADMPLIYGNGTYVLPHADGTIAIGATSERVFDDSCGTDALLDASLDRARALCPWIRGVTPSRRWAGLRPRGNGRDPMLGSVPGAPGVFAMMAGFKISFGIAAKAARDVLHEVDTGEARTPETFRVAHHLGKGD